MNVRSLLMVGGLGSVFGGVSAVLLLPFAVGQRLNRSGSAGECWVSVATAGLLVVFSTNDPVFLSSCGLLILADLARQQPTVPPESLVAFSLLIGASIHPSDLGSLEAVPLVMVLAGFASKGGPLRLQPERFVQVFWWAFHGDSCLLRFGYISWPSVERRGVGWPK